MEIVKYEFRLHYPGTAAAIQVFWGFPINLSRPTFNVHSTNNYSSLANFTIRIFQQVLAKRSDAAFETETREILYARQHTASACLGSLLLQRVAFYQQLGFPIRINPGMKARNRLKHKHRMIF